jgi:prophage regulatory protein
MDASASLTPAASTLLLIWSRSMTSVRKLVSKKELKSIYGVPYSFAHISRLEAAREFPQRLQLGRCRVAWFADEVEEWIASRPRVTMRAA